MPGEGDIKERGVRKTEGKSYHIIQERRIIRSSEWGIRGGEGGERHRNSVLKKEKKGTLKETWNERKNFNGIFVWPAWNFLYRGGGRAWE